jgi:hypothetical protein
MNEVIEIELTERQISQLAPLIRQHVDQGKNSLFVSTVSPNVKTWRWQLVSVSPSAGQKLLRLIREDSRRLFSASE